MKIGLFGNMNNMLFQVARYLRDANYDCTLFLFEEFEHFLPNSDVYDDEPKIKVVQLPWKKDNLEKTSSDVIAAAIKGFDYYIGTDIAPAFFFKAGYKLDIFYPHGSDLYEFPFPPFVNKVPMMWELENYFFGQYQFQGIHVAECIALDPSEEVYEKPLSKIKGNNFKRIGSAPFLYKHQYTNGYEQLSDQYSRFKTIRSQYDLILWQHISQDWSDRGPFKINKGNGILIRGFADYIKQSPKADKAILILLEYGGDVEKSKAYIASLGISKQVMWISKMWRKDIMAALTQVDFGVGELGYRRWYSYSSIFEYMQGALPIIHHRDDAYYRDKGFELYPMLDARESETITKVLLDFDSNPDKYKQIGKTSRLWVERDFEQRMQAFLDQIKSKSYGNEIQNHTSNMRRMKWNGLYISYSGLASYYKLKGKIRTLVKS
jgi:hypothetical protein